MAESPSHPPPTQDELALLDAAHAGDLQRVQALIAQGVNVNVQSNEFYKMRMHRDVTPLMCAASEGHLEIVSWLLEHGADHAAQTMLTKSEGGPGTEALHFAAAAGHEAIIARLLDAGANPNAEVSGRTPLSAALREGKLSCAKLLLSRGASPAAKPKQKRFDPPLVALGAAVSNTGSLVARNRKLVPAAQDVWDQKELLFELVECLLAGGADPDADGSIREIFLAQLSGRIPEEISVPLAKRLIAKGANPDAVNKSGDSPLALAVLYKSSGLARLFLEHPVEVNRLFPRGSLLDIVESNIETAKGDIASASTDDARAASEAQSHELQSLRDMLIARGAKRKSELPPPAEPASKPEKRHIASDFLQLVNTSEAEWALLAVKAPFDAVADAYFKFAKAKKRQKDVPIRPAADGQEIPPLAAVLQIQDSTWTIILRTIFYVRSPDLKHIASTAKELSKSLQTRALTWIGTNETDNGRCELFVDGEKTATANNARSIALLTREDLRMPACYPTREGDNAWLAVEEFSTAKVERADLIAR